MAEARSLVLSSYSFLNCDSDLTSVVTVVTTNCSGSSTVKFVTKLRHRSSRQLQRFFVALDRRIRKIAERG